MIWGDKKRRGFRIRNSQHRMGAISQCRLTVETLEDRRVLAADLGGGYVPWDNAPYAAEDLIIDPLASGEVSLTAMLARAQQRAYVPNELIVATTTSIDFFDEATWSFGASPVAGFPTVDFATSLALMAHSDHADPVQLTHIGWSDGADVKSAMKMLALQPGILWSAPNFAYYGDDARDLIPNDPSYGSQYHHPLMQNNLAWDVTLGDPSILIAVTDDGVATTHVDLNANIWVNPGEIPGNGLDDDGNGFIDDVNGWNFINNNNNVNPTSSSDDHGTHVAGIAAAVTNNGIGVAGTAGNATILPIKFYTSSSPGSWTSTVIFNSFKYAVDNGAQIISTSYNINGFVNDPTFISAMNYIANNGRLHFNSAGNGNQLNPPRQAFEQTLLVVSTDNTDRRSSFSNYGTGMDISAPGTSILSTILNNGYGVKSGTSMATPNAAGAAALIWSQNPTWNHFQVAAQLLGTADNIDALNPAQAGLLGAGRVNSFRALTETLAAPQIQYVTGIPEGSVAPGTSISEFRVAYNQVMDPDTVTNSLNYELRNAGPDGLFDTADDIIYTASAVNPYRVGTNELRFNIAAGGLGFGDYRFRILSGGVTNPFGTPLDGNGDGNSGGDFEQFFSIGINDFERQPVLGSMVSASLNNTAAIPSASDVVVFPFFVQAGETAAAIVRPLGGSATLSVQLVGESDEYTAAGPGAPVILPATAIASSGTRTVQVSGDMAANVRVDIYRNANLDGLLDTSQPIDLSDSITDFDLDRMVGLAKSNGTTGGVVFTKYNDPSKYVNIRNTGSPLNLGDDDTATITTTVGNSLFPAGAVSVSNNGGIMAGSNINLSFANTPLPASGIPGPALFPFWDDIGPGAGNVYWQERVIDGHHALVVQWHDRPIFPTVGRGTFQLQLFASGPLLARFVYPDVNYGNTNHNWGASATIGVQENPISAHQFSYNTPLLANFDVIDISAGSPMTDINDFWVDWTDMVGASIDVAVQGLGLFDFGAQTLQILDPNQNVVATGTTDASNFDLGIQGYRVASSGVHTVRVSSNIADVYSIMIANNRVFDTEPNNALSLSARDLTATSGAFGFLTATAGDRDVYRITLAEGQSATFETSTPLDLPAIFTNTLNPNLTIYDAAGNQLAFDANSLDGKNARLVFVAPAAGDYLVGVGRESGFGEYFLNLSTTLTVTGDFNGDGVYDCADINALSNIIASGVYDPTFDLTGDGQLTFADIEAWLIEAGEVNLGPGRAYLPGDANLDGAVDGADFVAWNANKFTANANWCDGDFNADGVIDGLDFVVWNQFKFQSADLRPGGNSFADAPYQFELPLTTAATSTSGLPAAEILPSRTRLAAEELLPAETAMARFSAAIPQQVDGLFSANAEQREARARGSLKRVDEAVTDAVFAVL